jgi:hypothetical protein
MSAVFDVFGEIQIIIDLAIENNRDRPILIENRLMPARNVNDRKTTMTKTGATVKIEPFVIRPPMNKHIGHAP